MAMVYFIYKDKKDSIICSPSEKMSDIFQRYILVNKINSKNIFFVYDGIKINEDLSFKEIINVKDFKRGTINVFVYEEEISKNIINNNYWDKINYKFKKNPNLKYKLEITDINSKYGYNDIFEVFISYRNNKEYIASPNKNTDNIDLFSLLDFRKIYSLQGHKRYIKTVRYFLNKKTFNDYLISADENRIVIVWDINNNFIIKYKINTKYGLLDHIYSCLLLFQNNEKNYIITSTDNSSFSPDLSATKIYSFQDGKYIKYIEESQNYSIWYLLSWHNKRNNQYYIIQFSDGQIILNDLMKYEYIFNLKKFTVGNHYSGFIYSNNNIDYLCSSTSNGLIIRWNLSDKTLFNVIEIYNSNFYHIISWNVRYIIVADYTQHCFKIIDLILNKVISKIKHKNISFRSVKKVNHPIYGESLLAAGYRYIELFTL